MQNDLSKLLTPEGNAFLEHLNSLNLPHTEDVPIATARNNYEKLSRNLGEVPVSIARIEDRIVPSLDNKDGVPVRVYWPELNKKLPLFVFIHGGGWNLGSINTHDPLCRRIAKEAGCIIVSIDYRLAPEHPYPAGLNDVQTAYQWCLDHATELSADPEKIAVGGDSGGGTLTAALMGTLVEDKKQLPKFHVLLYPALDLHMNSGSMDTFAKGYFLGKSTMKYFAKNYAGNNDVSEWKISPLFSSLVDKYPPAILLSTECDPLHDEGIAYKEKLLKAGNRVEHKLVPGSIHAFLQMIEVFPAQTKEAYTWICKTMNDMWNK